MFDLVHFSYTFTLCKFVAIFWCVFCLHVCVWVFIWCVHGQWVLLGLNWLSGLGLTTFPLGEQVTLNGSQSIFGRSELWLQLQSRLVPAHGFLKLLLVTRKTKTLDVVWCTYDAGEQLSVNIDGLLEKSVTVAVTIAI